MRDFSSRLEQTYAELGTCYAQNPRVLANPQVQYVPLAFYMDGVAFQWDRKDGAQGYWIVNLVTGRRHLVAVTRKRHNCRCGCRSWCTSFFVYQYLAWCMQVMLEGVYPTERYDGSSWGNHHLAGFAGQLLSYQGLVVMVKADWMEFASSLGFCNWNHHKHPCFACLSRQGAGADPEVHWKRVDGISPLSLPWRPKDQGWYVAACEAAEHTVDIEDQHLFVRVVAALESDRRSAGAHGRRLVVDVPELGLQQGMRLEPSPNHWDVYRVDDWIVDWPGRARLTFWGPQLEQGAHHRNPILDTARTGLSVSAFAVDEMHCMHLGVFGDYASCALWRLILDDPLQVGEAMDDTNRVRCERLDGELRAWYARRKADRLPVNELCESLWGVIGPSANPQLHCKAAVSGDVLRFTVDMVERHFRALTHGEALLAAGRALKDYLTVTRAAGPILSVSERQALVDGCKNFLTFSRKCGVSFKPKHHLYVHLVWSTHVFGNPLRWTSTWVDEGLNSQLASVAKGSHPLTWSKRIIATFSHERGPTATLTRRKRKQEAEG